MNKEIKFRAWTKSKNMEYNVVPFQWDYCINRMLFKCTGSNGPGALGHSGTEASWEVKGYSIVGGALMQYTGLKDKNGKEIYEGDVCEYKGAKYKICWGKILMGFYTVMTPKHIGHFLQNQNMGECEIIGNIYENKDLL